MFGDDHVRCTREQMMLQVDLVMRRVGVGLVLGEDFYLSYTILCTLRIM